jgi:hypothetical protein
MLSKKKVKLSRVPKKSSTCLLTPYSYFRLSERAGYASGIPYPWFCQQVFNKEEEEEKFNLGGSYTNSVQQCLSELSKMSQTQYYKISTADIIAAQHFAHNLASLRGRIEISPYDLLDAVKSTFLKDESGSTGVLLFRELNKLLIGNQVGFVPKELAQFAIEQDFFEQIRKNRLSQSDESRKVKCEIYKRENHRRKSRFLWMTRYLGLEYAELQTGPDYIKNEQLWLLTEQWIVKWHPEIIPRLIEYASYGGTIEEACTAKLLEEFESEALTNRRIMGHFLIRAVQMGLFNVFEKILQKINDELQKNTSFEELISLLRSVVVLYGFRESLLKKEHSGLKPVINNIYKTILHRIPDLSQISEELIGQVTDDFRTLSQIINNPLLSFLDASILFEIMKRTLKDEYLPPRLQGIFMGFLYSFGEINVSKIEKTFHSYSAGTLNAFITPIEFLEGTLNLSKAIIFSSNLLKILVNEIEKVPDDIFLQLLPGLRRLFTNYIPRETVKIAKEISSYGVEIDVFHPTISLPSDLALGLGNLDSEIILTLEKWNLISTNKKG